MILTLLLIALSSGPPAMNADKLCSSAANASLPEDVKAAIHSCVRDEQAARDKLRSRWSHYSAAARATCVQDGAGVPVSYVEMFVCLEMQPGGSLSLTGGAAAAGGAPAAGAGAAAGAAGGGAAGGGAR